MRERLSRLATIVGIVALLSIPAAAYMGGCGAREQPATTPAPLHRAAPTTIAPSTLATCSNLAIDGECGGIVSALSLLGSGVYGEDHMPQTFTPGSMDGMTFKPINEFAVERWATLGPSILSITEPSVTRNIGVYVDTYAGGAQAVVDMIERGTLTIGDIERIATEVCAKCKPGDLCDRLVVKNHSAESWVWSCEGKLYEEKTVGDKTIRVEVRSR